MVHGRLRSGLRQAHLVSSLVFGLMFVLAGLTGIPLAWVDELDGVLNPALFHVAPPDGRAGDTPGRWRPELVQRAVETISADPRYGRPDSLSLGGEADRAWVFGYRVKRDPDSLVELDRTRQVMWDPYRMRATGERTWGEIGVSRPLLMPTLFFTHRYLLLGETGKTVMGVSGLAMLLTSLVGLALWWPKATWSSLGKAVTVRVGGSPAAFNYSLHRAVGIFALPVLAVLGFSGWYFNLPTWVTPLVGAVAAMAPNDKVANAPALVAGGAARPAPIGVAQAMRVAQARFPEARLSRVGLPAGPKTPYELRMRQPGEVRKGSGNTRVSVDAYQGTILKVRDPLTAAPGDRFLGWQFPLHTGEAFGVPGRVLITLAGVTPLLFMWTGLLMWWRRRHPRVKSGARAQPPRATAEPDHQAPALAPARSA
ncbi:PepSY-associated TM helix domain-containing protein [Pseudoduganella namucuonensis]|uniref:Uncharacterized iron-regulated membrane protein n=1 Tax=Pseudoduganella namucuonensis TaxID=1035707 RepID=A0A1I7M3N3_9BURK|nr:PepSY-associated TM helix domain-containing protein [Pseudoduganella namucuonensis]SFV16430.1 Uncharacterized iron-regulated membrane protein [Pseudoduganella namucuonensis]